MSSVVVGVAVTAAVAAGTLVHWVRTHRAEKNLQLEIEVHRPTSGPGRIIIYNSGTQSVARVVVRVEGSWLDPTTGAFVETKPTGFGHIAPRSSVEIPLVSDPLGLPGSKKVEVYWRDFDGVQRVAKTTLSL
jgi:hypothetical protein